MIERIPKQRPASPFVHSFTWCILLAILATLPVSCSGGRDAERVNRATPIALAEVPESRIEFARDWRDARTVPAGEHVVDLGPIPENGAVVLSFFPKGYSQERPSATVFAGDRSIRTVQQEHEDRWSDFRIDLADMGGLELPCKILFSSKTDLFVARCELVPGPTAPPNVLVFLIDTLRPDHLGCYGYNRDTSPNVDALAAEGLRFTEMISQSSWTRPAVASLLTSTYPAVHEAKDRLDVLRSDLPTLAETFQVAGYQTQGFMCNPNCLPAWGFDRGFARFLDLDSYTINPDKDKDAVDAVVAALERDAGSPWFYYVHVVGPHEPYEPPAPYDTQFAPDAADDNAEHATARALYDGEIGFTDLQFGRVVDTMKRLGIYDNSLIVVTSDHGEEFWEHGGTGHGSTLFDEQIRIPFIMKLPQSELAGTVVDGVCQIIDVAPTIFEALELPRPASFQGSSLTGLVRGELRDQPFAYSSLFFDKYSAHGARSREFKYINDSEKNLLSWFDLLADPGELHPLESPPEDQRALARFASQIAASGNDGLHILVTGSLKEPHTIEGTIDAEGLGVYSLHYLANNAEITKTETGLTFRITTSPGPNSPFDIIEFHEENAEQNNAHLRVAADSARPIRISLILDGVTAPDDVVFVGPSKTPRSLHDAVLQPAELFAGAESFFPSALPRRLAVYIWFVPGPDTIEGENLEPGMADALKSLGYL